MSDRREQFMAELRVLSARYPEYNVLTPFANPGKAIYGSGKRFLISMLGFNNLVLSKYCIESVLENSTPGTYHLRLTNNGSTDGTREYFDQIASQFPHVTVVHEPENTGFQAPNEKAFIAAKQLHCDFVIYLNNDATVPPGWLEKLAEPMDADEKVAVTGPFGGCSRVNDQMCGCDDTKLEYIEFSCACVRVSIASKWPTMFAPWLDFIYGEDLEACLRFQYAGYKIHRSAFRIAHRGSQTAGAHPEAKERCAAANKRNLALMCVKYAHWLKVRRFDHAIIVKRSYAKGDVLLATPIVRALHAKYPLCPIYVETDNPDAFERNPCVKQAGHVIGLNLPELSDAMMINLDGSYEARPERHVLESYAEAAGLEMNEVNPRLEYRLPEWTINLEGKWCAVHVGPTAWPGKNWPLDHWNAVIQSMRSRGWKVMVFGNGPKDASVLCDKDMRGQSGVPELAVLLSRCGMFIGLDSFPAHLAAALKVPSVVLFGLTRAECFYVHGGLHYLIQSNPNHSDTGRRNMVAGITFLDTTDEVMRTITATKVIDATVAMEGAIEKRAEEKEPL